MFSSRGTVRYEERGQGYRDVEEVGKHSSTRSAQHVSGNLLPIFRSVILRFLQHMVFCCLTS